MIRSFRLSRENTVLSCLKIKEYRQKSIGKESYVKEDYDVA
jgi:hypothetical protein